MHIDENTPRAVAELLERFHAAERAWSAEIVKVFGRADERMARFLPEGRGEPGTALHAAYVERCMALADYEKLYEASKPRGAITMPAIEVTIPLAVTARMKLRVDALDYDLMTSDELHELARERVREAINAIGTEEIPVRCRGSIFLEIEGPIIQSISVADPRG